MGRVCKIAGSLLAVLGLAVVIWFALAMARDEAYRHAELAYTRNAGNAMYELEFRGAQVRRAFQGVGAVAGILLTLNGVTLLVLGVVASRTAARTQ